LPDVFDTERFWQFSLKTYEKHGVKECCLSLQDSYGVDVNLLLLCHWLDSQEQVLSRQTLDDLIALSTNWQTKALVPLREKRATLAKGSEAYGFALTEELKAERQEQRALLALLNLADMSDEQQPFTQNTNCIAYADAARFPPGMLTPLFKGQH